VSALPWTPAILALLVAGVLAALLWPRPVVAQLARFSPRVVYFVPTDKPVVALTIDDGPDSTHTPKMLDLLAEQDARATFFVMSRRAADNRGVVQRLVSEGHELGNHLVEDNRAVQLNGQRLRDALAESHAFLSAYAPVRWFRPPGGWYSRRIVAAAERFGYRTALGSVYPYDASVPSARFAFWFIRLNLHPGAILVLHDGPHRAARTVQMLTRLLPYLHRRGYRCVTLSELADLGG